MRVRMWDVAWYLKLFFWIHIEVSLGISFLKSAMISVKVFLKILSQCNAAVKGSGTTVWWQSSTGKCTVMHRTQCTVLHRTHYRDAPDTLP